MRRYDIINYLIEQSGYRTYLEIGVDNPANNFDRVLAKHKTGVDPAGNCAYRMTSDDFFERHPDVKWDIIFIDGLHTSAQSAVDIKNALSHLGQGGSIVVHDCNPPTEWHTRPLEQFQADRSAWNGTTYKALVGVKQTNLGLSIHTVDTDWGCGIIQDPNRIDFKMPSHEFTWDEFDSHRKQLLNLIGVEEFKELYKVSWWRRVFQFKSCRV